MKALQAVVQEDGQVRLLEQVTLKGGCRAIVVLIDDEQRMDSALLSEPALAKDWSRPEEEEAWKDLARVPSL